LLHFLGVHIPTLVGTIFKYLYIIM
jgi:hypothetical protein